MASEKSEKTDKRSEFTNSISSQPHKVHYNHKHAKPHTPNHPMLQAHLYDVECVCVGHHGRQTTALQQPVSGVTNTLLQAGCGGCGRGGAATLAGKGGGDIYSDDTQRQTDSVEFTTVWLLVCRQGITARHGLTQKTCMSTCPYKTHVPKQNHTTANTIHTTTHLSVCGPAAPDVAVPNLTLARCCSGKRQALVLLVTAATNTSNTTTASTTTNTTLAVAGHHATECRLDGRWLQ